MVVKTPQKLLEWVSNEPPLGCARTNDGNSRSESKI